MTVSETFSIVREIHSAGGTHMQGHRPNDLIKVTAARKRMGISPMKMAQLIKDGFLRTFDNPLDKRVKLVSQAEVDSLLDMRDKAA
ncbi:MAG TPA: hypothetical protein VGV59_20905 [Pyrinomonadaceae bacterium]|nr:hypothetical protein [Pyrinomonadaceae bacterium]